VRGLDNVGPRWARITPSISRSRDRSRSVVLPSLGESSLPSVPEPGSGAKRSIRSQREHWTVCRSRRLLQGSTTWPLLTGPSPPACRSDTRWARITPSISRSRDRSRSVVLPSGPYAGHAVSSKGVRRGHFRGPRATKTHQVTEEPLRDNLNLIDHPREAGQLAEQVPDTGGCYFVTVR
jgi:hypothetical protein